MIERLRGRWRTALGLWRRHGLGALASLANHRLGRGGLVLRLFGLATPIAAETVAQPRSIEVHEATRQELERHSAEWSPDWDALGAFDLGDRCLIQTVEGRLAGRVWMSTRPAVELLPGVWIRVPDDAVYSYRTWTEAGFRGHGLQALRHRAVLDAARPQGRTRLFCFAASTNFDSLKGMRRSGCVPIGSVKIHERGENVSFAVKITDPTWSAVVAVPALTPPLCRW